MTLHGRLPPYVRRMTRYEWLDWIGILFCGLVTLHSMAHRSDWISVVVAWAYPVIVLVMIIVRRRTHKSVIASLREAEYLICWQCGYDLRGTDEPRCPECGTEFSRDELIAKWKNWALERSL